MLYGCLFRLAKIWEEQSSLSTTAWCYCFLCEKMSYWIKVLIWVAWSSHIFTGTFITLNSGTLLQELFLKKVDTNTKKKRISRAFYSEHFLVVFVKTLFPKCLRFPRLVLIRLVSIEIQRFKNVKINKEMYGHPDTGHTFLCKF